MSLLAKNKKAYFDYQISETLEAGIVLSGQEVKSAKTGGIQLTGAYAKTLAGEIFLINGHIKPYKHASNLSGYDPTRTRKLLLHKSEILKLQGRLQEKGLTLLPLEAYTHRGKIKIKLGLGKAKKKTDKREAIKKRETEKKIRQIIKIRSSNP